MKAVLRRKFVAVNIYIKKEERSQVNNVTVHLKGTRKMRSKLNQSQQKAESKDRVEINGMENRKTREYRKSTKPKLVFFKDHQN